MDSAFPATPFLAVLEFPPIRDIAPPVEPTAGLLTPWAWWLAAALLGLLLITLLFIWFRAVGRRAGFPSLPPSPAHAAASQLESLRREAPALSADAFAAALSEIIRIFLQRQTGIPALFSTSPEILGDRPRPHEPPPPPALAAFRQLLTDSDALKYGPTGPDQSPQKDAIIDSALAAIQKFITPRPPAVPPPLPVAHFSASACTTAQSSPPPMPPAVTNTTTVEDSRI